MPLKPIVYLLMVSIFLGSAALSLRTDAIEKTEDGRTITFRFQASEASFYEEMMQLVPEMVPKFLHLYERHEDFIRRSRINPEVVIPLYRAFLYQILSPGWGEVTVDGEREGEADFLTREKIKEIKDEVLMKAIDRYIEIVVWGS